MNQRMEDYWAGWRRCQDQALSVIQDDEDRRAVELLDETGHAHALRRLELYDVEVAGLMMAGGAYLRQASESDNMSPAVETALGKLEAAGRETR